MKKKKNKMFIIFLVIFVIEVLLQMGLDYKLNIGKNPETGKFAVWNTKHEFNLQEKISEEFQPDMYAKEHGEEVKFYGSRNLYLFFVKIFGEGAAISAFCLIRMLLILDILLIFIAIMVKRGIKQHPSKRQILFEQFYSYFDGLVKETLGKERTSFTPYIVTLFLFVWASNMIGLIPIPGFMEPTRNLNVPLGLGVLAILIVHITSIRVNGVKNYIKDYFEPLPFLAPLEIVGVFSNVVSISFRLFGNILGGAIIILVVSSLVKFVLLPVGLNFFFGIFVGTIQAFVFTMLALTYIGVAISE